MKPINERLEEIKTNGYQLDFSVVFEHAFENYKKIALYAGLMLFVFSILIGVFIVGIAISIYGIAAITENLKPENFEPRNLSGNFIILYVLGVVLFSSLLSPFQAGFLKMADCAEKNEEFHFSTIFEYYKTPFFQNLFIVTLIITLLSMSVSMALEYAGYQFTGTVISLAISFLTLLTIPLIIFGNLNAIDAIKASIIIVSKQPLMLLGLIIVAFLVSMVGFIGCCIGVIFTIPFMYSMYYSIYETIIGVDTKNDLEEIQ